MSSVNVPIDCDDIGWDWVNVVVNGGMDLELMYNRILGEASVGFKDNLVVYMINGLICILICFLYRVVRHILALIAVAWVIIIWQAINFFSNLFLACYKFDGFDKNKLTIDNNSKILSENIK
ncbi:hypothetical protein, partial [Klebsiella quasipneumoniae]|uniref:hypothetical protein n=2 Tax=Klebsiella TaxID=570 RepID=UPI0022313941